MSGAGGMVHFSMRDPAGILLRVGTAVLSLPAHPLPGPGSLACCGLRDPKLSCSESFVSDLLST